VFFADFDNNVTKEGLCEFYGIKNIEVGELSAAELKNFENLQATKK